MRIKNREKLTYSILKEIECKNCTITENDYCINKEMFYHISEIINDNGYIKNISFNSGNNVSYAEAQITLEGMNYLKERSKLADTYKGLKEISYWFDFG